MFTLTICNSEDSEFLNQKTFLYISTTLQKCSQSSELLLSCLCIYKTNIFKLIKNSSAKNKGK